MKGAVKPADNLIKTIKGYAEATPFQHVSDTSKVLKTYHFKTAFLSMA